ncbi:MAG: glycosyltransferase family 87 protein, partial [Phycisphaerae bacterium]
MRSQRRFGEYLPWALLLLLVAGYAALAPLTAGHDDKDWSHLWLGGRMVVAGRSADLYDPQAQVAVYRQADPNGNPPKVWAPRNDVLGCFNYPPPAALAYATLAWLDMPTAAVVHAFLNVAVAVLVAFWFCRHVGRGEHGATMALAVLAYPAFFVNLSIGQNAVWSTSVGVVGGILIWRRLDLMGGVVLGLLCLKPNWL